MGVEGRKGHQDTGCDRRPKPPRLGAERGRGNERGWGAHSLLSLRLKGERVAAYNSGSSLLSTLGLVGKVPVNPGLLSLQTWEISLTHYRLNPL